ncbi:MAG: SUMF1/EgtB/PvdO family nonheme iron enzyme [Kiritimatiellae bacterium]|nr:SUMF1/EgtB/PvdO family nonheme iron enzyme [Kiritimatiellia bacterium]
MRILTMIPHLGFLFFFSVFFFICDHSFAASTDAFRVQQLRAECERFNAAAANRALTDLSANPAYDAVRHRAAVNAFATRRDWVSAHLDDANESVRDEAVSLVDGYRAAFLANPALDFDRILCVLRRMPLPKNEGTRQLGLLDINAHNHMRAARTGFTNEIAVISNLRGTPSFSTLYRPTDTSLVRDLDLDFDASRVSFTQHRGNDMWGVFEIELDEAGKRKGKNCVAISPDTYPDVHWVNGCYLPNENQMIVLGSGVHQYLPCENGNMLMLLLYRIDRKTGEIRQLTYEQDSDYTPSVLNDGRVVFTRWEYSDMQHYFARELMTMNPDGVGQLALWGSGSYFPTFFYKARAIPNDPHRLVMIGGGHHGIAEKGRMFLVDPTLARAYPYRYDPPDRAWGPTLHQLRVPTEVLPASQTGLVQEFPGWGKDVEGDVCDLQVANQFNRKKPYLSYPYPLDGKYFLATCQMEPLGRFGIYLVDIFDNMILLAEALDGMLFEPIPLRPRKRPPVIPDRSDPARKDCTVHIADIHTGPGLASVPRGTVKKLRLFSYHFNYHQTGGPNSVGLDWAESSWDIKRVLGTVDIEADGSCCFRMPARLPVSFQPLDAEGRAIQLMRSWVVAMPGERVSCTGCHEDNRTSVATERKLADQKPIQEIQAMDGDGIRPFAFATEMWPLLQKRCAACHGDAATAPLRGWDQGGDGKSARLVMRTAEEGYRFVHPYVRRPGAESELPVLNPMEYHASTSPLVQMLKKGHHGVTLDDAEWRALYTWIDLNAPWRGKWDPKETEQPPRRIALSKLFGGNTDDPEREYEHHAALVKARGTPKPVVPPRVQRPTNTVSVAGWPISTVDAYALQVGHVTQRAPVTTRTLELGAGQSMTFRCIPAGTFVMGSTDGSPDESPCVVTIPHPFWISETEVRNDQYRVFDPSHDSRHQDQIGFDQVVPGYVGTHRRQPAVRLSWNQAMEFCRWFSKKAGVKANLPTEAQWEWAARAGTGTPFPWGGIDDDFSKYANLADRDVRFALGVWDGPATVQRRREFKHSMNYPLHEERFTDDWFCINYVARVLPNTWGLYDMHGNAAEWTRSTYRPYPYRADDGRENESADGLKVVRGGSFASRPRNATSSFRQAYLSWQKVFDTGFRVVIEEE